MSKGNIKKIGDAGEQYIVDHVLCPNCDKKLMNLPPNYPLADVQCTACLFRAQVKTTSSRQRQTICGAGWDIFEKVLKAGHLAPALIAHFLWKEGNATHHKVILYPFIPRKCLKKYQLSAQARRSKYRMFNYVNLGSIPSMVLLES